MRWLRQIVTPVLEHNLHPPLLGRTSLPYAIPTGTSEAVRCRRCGRRGCVSERPTLVDTAGTEEKTLNWELHTAEAFGALRTLAPSSVDAVITDPPYSSGGAFRGDRARPTTTKYVKHGAQPAGPEFGGDTRDQRGFLAWATLWLSECFRATHPGGVACVFTDWRQLPVMSDALQAAGWTWRGIVVWDKTEAVMPHAGRFRQQAEFVVWGSRGPLTADEHRPILPGVFRHSSNWRHKRHIAGKPEGLMRDLVGICPPGGLVLDPFAGSGTTGVACLAEGRRFLGYELDPCIAEDARCRLESATSSASNIRQPA
jgi:site-specific DNA-methyltransferase (adenine-specific)